MNTMKKLYKSLSIIEVPKERKDDCQSYNICLTFASSKNWRSFSCSNCKFYIKTDKFQPPKFNRITTPLVDNFI